MSAERAAVGGVDLAEVRRLAVLAWPVVVAQVAFMAMGVVDTVMVGHFDGRALAGVALGSTWVFAWLALGRGVAIGLDPAITQAVGAQDDAAFDRAMAHGAVLLSLLAVPVTLLHFVAAAGLGALGEPPGALALAQAYAVGVAPAVWPAMMGSLLRQGLQARGRMRPSMWVAVLGNVVNVPANLVFLHGIGDWEGFGAVGVAWSTTLVRWAMLAAYVALAWSETRAVVRGLAQVHLARLWALAAIAGPVGVQTGLEVWGFTIGTLVAGWFGEQAVAAHTVTMNLAALAFMVPLGVSSAAATRVGNLLGAGRAWQTAGWSAILLGACVMLVSASLFVLVPDALAGIYVPDAPEIRALAATLLPLAGLFAVFDGTQVVAFGVLRGAGDTHVPSLANIVGYYLIGLPLGGALAWWGGLGVRGVWVGLIVALATVAMLLLARTATIASRGGVRRMV